MRTEQPRFEQPREILRARPRLPEQVVVEETTESGTARHGPGSFLQGLEFAAEGIGSRFDLQGLPRRIDRRAHAREHGDRHVSLPIVLDRYPRWDLQAPALKI